MACRHTDNIKYLSASECTDRDDVMFTSAEDGTDTERGGSRANLKEGQLVVAAVNYFRKLMTRVRGIQQFQIHFWNKQHNFEVILEAN